MCHLCGRLFTMRHNGLALGAVADFGALNCQPSTKFDARQNVQLTTSPAIAAKRLLCVRCFSFVLIVCRLRVGTDTLFAKFWLVCRLVRLGNVCGC
ncbi:MAG: hypothetical protein M9911_14445 [Saprospiraceae bacterium]|nr:hypothetical protein [Saprospiraceae bacterium]